jgi:alkylhydroperoxidase/carboxymuconolactone decarboxylase family protein YurZ
MPKPSEHNEQFRESFPEVWNAFSKLAEQCHKAGPLDDHTRRLIKVAVSIGAGLERATHSAVRHARDAGVTQEQLEHVAVLAITTLGFPSAMRALSWVKDSEPR